MFIKDLDGRYVLINDKFASRFGVAPDGAVAHTDGEIFDPATANLLVNLSLIRT